MKNIFAFTETAYKTYPAFISINKRLIYDGQLEVTVRSPENNGTSMGTIVLTDDQIVHLIISLRQYLTSEKNP